MTDTPTVPTATRLELGELPLPRLVDPRLSGHVLDAVVVSYVLRTPAGVRIRVDLGDLA